MFDGAVTAAEVLPVDATVAGLAAVDVEGLDGADVRPAHRLRSMPADRARAGP